MPYSFPHLGARVAYDGASFSGFQRQPHRNSIQAELERAFSVVLKKKISIQFASRTDSGVHALDQWIVIKDGLRDVPPILSQRLLVALNGVLPPTIRIWKLMRLREDFHAKESPLWKEYQYRILQGPVMPPLDRHSSLWIRRELDWKRIQSAVKEFEGIHDFAAFSKRNRRYGEKTLRRILKAQMSLQRHRSLETHLEVRFIFRGEGFLHHMVRTMVGTLIDIGDGKANRIQDAFRSRRRVDAGVNAPPGGLLLRRIFVPKRFVREFTDATACRGAAAASPQSPQILVSLVK